MANPGDRLTIKEMKQIATNKGYKFIEKLDHNTFRMKDDEFGEDLAIYIVQFHDTEILVTNKHGTACFTGGWLTTTTKDRLNKFSPIGNFYSDKGVWYITTPTGTYPFTEGCFIRHDGEVIYDEDEVEMNKYIRKLISSYIKKLKSLDEIPRPSPGDCFVCKFPEPNCILSHLEEGYIHGTLIINALRAAGGDDFFINWVYLKGNKGLYDFVYRDVRKYLKSAMGV